MDKWDYFLSHTLDLFWVLREVTEKGILIDKEQRASFKKKLTNELAIKEKELDVIIPEELYEYKYWNNKAPKKIDKDKKGKKALHLRCPHCKGRGKLQTGDKGYKKGAKDDKCKKCKGTGTKVKLGTKNNSRGGRVPRPDELFSGYVQGRSGELYIRSIEDEGRYNWAFRYFFKAKSPLHVKRYIKWSGHPIPKHGKTKKDTTGQKDLENLYAKFPDSEVYKKILEVRSISDLLSKYADNPAWSPAKDGRVHPRFNFNPSTGRLASEKPNIQNPVKRGIWGKEFRNQFIAGSGFELVAIDYSSIEAVLVGFYALDSDFIRASKLSIHAILASVYLKKLGKMKEPISMQWDDKKIKDQVRIIKKKFFTEYDRAKKVVYLSLYGGTPFLIFHNSAGVFSSIKQCQDLQNMFFSTLGKKLKAWQRSVLELAHKQCYLENPFGHRHYFWDVLNSKGYMGSQAKDALAYPAQSTASSIYKQVMVSLRPEITQYLRAPIHDELLFELPEGRTDYIEEIIAEMQKPIPQLTSSDYPDGLTIGVEWASGKKWGEID